MALEDFVMLNNNKFVVMMDSSLMENYTDFWYIGIIIMNQVKKYIVIIIKWIS